MNNAMTRRNQIMFFFFSIILLLFFDKVSAMGPEESIWRLKAYYGTTTKLLTKYHVKPGYRIGTGIEYRMPHTFLMLEADIALINTELVSGYRNTRLSIPVLLNLELGTRFFFSGGVGFLISPLLSQNFENDNIITKPFNIGPLFKLEAGARIFSNMGITISIFASRAENQYYEMQPTHFGPPIKISASNYLSYLTFGITYFL